MRSHSSSQGAGHKSSPANNQAEIDRIKVYENEVNYSVFSHLPALRQVVKDSPTGKWYETNPLTKRYLLAADLGTHNGKLALVFMLHSAQPSRPPDSSILLFRPDGTLAKYILIVETWTNGKLVKITGRIQYFNAKGDVLLTVNASKDNKTRQYTAAPTLSRPWLPIYKKTSALPFYNLIKTRPYIPR